MPRIVREEQEENGQGRRRPHGALTQPPVQQLTAPVYMVAELCLLGALIAHTSSGSGTGTGWRTTAVWGEERGAPHACDREGMGNKGCVREARLQPIPLAKG
jgi:hypothetical protein